MKSILVRSDDKTSYALTSKKIFYDYPFVQKGVPVLPWRIRLDPLGCDGRLFPKPRRYLLADRLQFPCSHDMGTPTFASPKFSNDGTTYYRNHCLHCVQFSFFHLWIAQTLARSKNQATDG